MNNQMISKLNNNSPVHRIAKELNRPFDLVEIMDNVFGNKGILKRMEVLPLEIIESPNQYMINVEIPGVEKENININIDKGQLTITVNAIQKKEEKEGDKVILSEFYNEKKSRSIYVGEKIDENAIKATYKNGLLLLEIPKMEKNPTQRQITID